MDPFSYSPPLHFILKLADWSRSQWKQWICCWWLVMPKHWIFSSNHFCVWYKSWWKTPIQIYKFWQRIRYVRLTTSNFYSYPNQLYRNKHKFQIKIFNAICSLYGSLILKKTRHHIIDATISLYRNLHRCAMGTMIMPNCVTRYDWLVYVVYRVLFEKRCRMIWWPIFGINSIWRKLCRHCCLTCKIWWVKDAIFQNQSLFVGILPWSSFFDI